MRIDKFINNGLFGTTLWGDVKPIAGVDVVINTSEQLSCVNYYMINDARFAKTHNNMYGEPLSIEDSLKQKQRQRIVPIKMIIYTQRPLLTNII